MDELERFAQATGLKIIRDAHCPPDRFYLVSKKVLDKIANELGICPDCGRDMESLAKYRDFIHYVTGTDRPCFPKETLNV